MAKQNKKQDYRLIQALVLNRFFLSLFRAKKLEELAVDIKDPHNEELTDDNRSKIISELKYRIRDINEVDLLGYDDNIVKFTAEINSKRDVKISWKYFQYLALLFTEIYLDKFFSNKEKLLADLNAYLENEFVTDDDNCNQLSPFTLDDLNKIAFWNATGSGKTLLMHINIKQFLYYSKGKFHNRIILITPNEGLSNQHIVEFKESNIDAEIFNKASIGGFFKGDKVEIIEISKIKESSGDKTIAVDAFEQNNLVLVDEGHRGASSDENVWKDMRKRVAEKGFSFEYSATFGQMVNKESGADKEKLLNEYGKSIIFDYSYRYFYNDGYGKDYKILNINDTKSKDKNEIYLVACLLNFYEQLYTFQKESTSLQAFLLEKPLAVFVGGSVTATTTNKEISDIVYILKFLQKFIKDRNSSIDNISKILSGEDGLVNKNNYPIFKYALVSLKNSGKTPEQVYSNMLLSIFNSSISGALLHLDNIKTQNGEIGVRVGEADYFGVINVGDSKTLLKNCEDAGIPVGDRDFSQKSLFATINSKKSSINILIGSRKFTEGWNSWRVSTMGLMNIGKSEGSQIIQLFGRGVRLRGYKHCLKRSSAKDIALDKDVKKPDNIGIIETLNIFGISADYMEQFQDFLRAEGLPPNDSQGEIIDIILPTINLGGKKLKIIKLDQNKKFHKEVVVNFQFEDIKVKYDFYPKAQMLSSKDGRYEEIPEELHFGKLTEKHLYFVDWNEVYFELQQLKNTKGWYNLTIPYENMRSIFDNDKWYSLAIPTKDLEFSNFETQVAKWQNIATTLLKLYIEKLYISVKSEWESKNMIAVELDENDPNFIEKYQIEVERESSLIIERLIELKKIVESGSFKDNFDIMSDFKAVYFSQHLYQPLLCINRDSGLSKTKLILSIKPVALNEGEKQFVEDIKKFHQEHYDFFDGTELYLLRNRSRSGIGFFEVSNFFPDFILWLNEGAKQRIAFIDPKGLRQIEDALENSKIMLHRRIKETIEPIVRNNDDNIRLNSFIVTPTPFIEIKGWRRTIDECNSHNLYFQKNQQKEYIDDILRKILNN